MYYELSVYAAVSALIKDVYALQRNLPRDLRYTVGQEVLLKLVQVLHFIYAANLNRGKNRAESIGSALSHMEFIMISFRVFNSLNVLSEKQYVGVSYKISDVIKQLTKWHNSLRN